MESAGDMKDNFAGSVTVGERGQVVIPAEARERCGIQAGDKLLAFVHPGGQGVLLVRLPAAVRLASQLLATAQDSELLESASEAEEE